MTARSVSNDSARLPALDGVRAIAVIGVIASHSGVFGLGWVGVDIFFGLSGYLITGILIDAKVPTANIRDYFVSFYMRRALRILPLAWVFLVLVCWIRGEWSGFAWYLGYVVNWLPQSPPPRDLGHYWSLAVEEQFYLFWPAVVYFASRTTLLRVTIGLIAIDVACRFYVSMWPPEFASAQFRDLATFARADTLLVGAMLAQRERNGGWGREVAWALPVAVGAVLVFVALRMMERQAALPILTYNLKWPVIALGVGAALIVVLTRPPPNALMALARLGRPGELWCVHHPRIIWPMAARALYFGSGSTDFLESAWLDFAACRLELVLLRVAASKAQAALAHAIRTHRRTPSRGYANPRMSFSAAQSASMPPPPCRQIRSRRQDRRMPLGEKGRSDRTPGSPGPPLCSAVHPLAPAHGEISAVRQSPGTGACR